jgi:molybdopterin-guanine dinucleotide biosynthesis protein A
MKAMILAAGLGTRFKPWTDHHPKALALVNGKSLLERNILYLQKFGINIRCNSECASFRCTDIYETILGNAGWEVIFR